MELAQISALIPQPEAVYKRTFAKKLPIAITDYQNKPEVSSQHLMPQWIPPTSLPRVLHSLSNLLRRGATVTIPQPEAVYKRTFAKKKLPIAITDYQSKPEVSSQDLMHQWIPPTSLPRVLHSLSNLLRRGATVTLVYKRPLAKKRLRIAITDYQSKAEVSSQDLMHQWIPPTSLPRVLNSLSNLLRRGATVTLVYKRPLAKKRLRIAITDYQSKPEVSSQDLMHQWIPPTSLPRVLHSLSNLLRRGATVTGRRAEDAAVLKDERLQRRTLIPPLPRKYHGHRSGNLHPPGLSKDLSHSHVPPLSLGSCEGYHLSTHPSFLFTSALVPNKRNTAVDYCQLNRPKVSHRTYNPSTIKDIQKVQGSYPDPMAGAPHSFLHRVSELSRMTEEAARQERLRRNSKSRKLEP
ncbi:hypothetical protein NHX12_021442 [Muraenolepis orangiensis]|uniref:Uncharacterized protein n=1 Tax=Muraenolepis orangiensis TaxID=630683 RepID=A0A9Q0ISC0_9TELE|nr:hypothetical protein NHX12_021442 [Muraenolepis orangiensis]